MAKKRKKLPTVLYVRDLRETDDILIVADKVSDENMNNGEIIGVYELVSTKKVNIKTLLEDA